MALCDETVRSCTRRLMLARMRLLNSSGFFGLLLMHMRFSLDEELQKPATDGDFIAFPPALLMDYSDDELDFILRHEVLHAALRHCARRPGDDRERFDRACDIVVNSMVLEDSGPKALSSLTNLGTIEHLAPDGRPGHRYSAEEIYAMLPAAVQGEDDETQSGSAAGSGDDEAGDGTPSDGESGDGKNSDNEDEADDSSRKDGKGGSRGKKSSRKSGRGKGRSGGSAGTGGSPCDSPDDHSRWKSGRDNLQRDIWSSRILDAAEAISIRDPSNLRGLMPAFMARLLNELRKPQTDWRTILNEFVQEEICDYSFSPPDRRFYESPFFLPDFNEKDESVKNVLFMIDTSASMSDSMIAAAYSEIKGAIEQFNGRLAGWLGFFDAVVVEPQPFADEDELTVIRPKGGGGTSFDVIFDYVREEMEAEPPVSIIILTDGYAPFPEEEAAMGIPVLWLLNNEEVKPPWGKVTRITMCYSSVV